MTSFGFITFSFCWLSVVEGPSGTPHAHLDLAPD